MDTLFSLNDRGEMTYVNDWRGQQLAPLFYLGRTQTSSLARFRFDLPEVTRQQLLEIVQQEAPSRSFAVLNDFESYVGLLNEFAGQTQVWTGPAYYFAEPVDARFPENIIQVHPNKSEILRPLMPDWLPDVPHEQPMMAWVEEGKALGICASVRTTVAAMAAGVEVVESARRRGIGAELVRAWASQVQMLGKIAMYSTSSDNRASQNLAQRLGLSYLGSDFHVSTQ